jgi:hypothetical protein
MIDTSGSGAIVTPRKTFPRTDKPAPGSGWYDPHTSPDGSRCVWLVIEQLFPVRTSLMMGDTTTGAMRTLVPGKDWVMQTDALWVDDSTLVSSRHEGSGFRLGLTDPVTGSFTAITTPADGSILAPWVVR